MGSCWCFFSGEAEKVRSTVRVLRRSPAVAEVTGMLRGNSSVDWWRRRGGSVMRQGAGMAPVALAGSNSGKVARVVMR